VILLTAAVPLPRRDPSGDRQDLTPTGGLEPFATGRSQVRSRMSVSMPKSMNVRGGNQVVSMASVIVNAQGDREILGCDVSPSEDADF
jgi:hypothetical protein